MFRLRVFHFVTIQQTHNLQNVETDLREDKQFLSDHPAAVPITNAQVYY